MDGVIATAVGIPIVMAGLGVVSVFSVAYFVAMSSLRSLLPVGDTDEAVLGLGDPTDSRGESTNRR